MKRGFFLSLFSITLAFTLTSCGGGSNKSMPVQVTGTAANLQFGDATNDQIAKFELTVGSIVLKGSSSATPDTANLLSTPAELEFVHTAGTLEPFSVGHIPPGTYASAVWTISNPEVVVVNGTTPTKVPATLASTTVTITFTSPITVASTPLFLNFDLDVVRSVTLNGTPVTSATVNPVFTVTTSTVAPDEGNEDHDDGEIEDVHGKVASITAPNFTITTNAGASITFATDANTKFKDGITQLSDLKTGDIVEVDGVTKKDGTKLATKVEREGNENGEEAEGLISAFDNPLTKITIVHQVDSGKSPATMMDISVNSSTVFSVRSDRLNIAAPAFDATHIGKGQRIEADSSSSNTTPIAAAKIKLREQALVGTVASSPAPTASGFTLNVSPTSAFGALSGATTVTVTFASGIHKLVTPAAGGAIRVRGLIFVNGAAYSMIAVRSDGND